jgi:hypothetical protein
MILSFFGGKVALWCQPWTHGIQDFPLPGLSGQDKIDWRRRRYGQGILWEPSVVCELLLLGSRRHGHVAVPAAKQQKDREREIAASYQHAVFSACHTEASPGGCRCFQGACRTEQPRDSLMSGAPPFLIDAADFKTKRKKES